VQTIVGGDGKVGSIMAASILAKVERDAEMLRLHERYPQYGFAQNKGYGTPGHLEALRAHGPCPIHRRLFGPVAQMPLLLEPRP
jgi:ribonuclease HII